jgi:hypothetical protein
MRGRYLGHLSHGDPLYAHIQGQIVSQLGFNSPVLLKPDYIIYEFPEMRRAVDLFERQ